MRHRPQSCNYYSRRLRVGYNYDVTGDLSSSTAYLRVFCVKRPQTAVHFNLNAILAKRWFVVNSVEPSVEHFEGERSAWPCAKLTSIHWFQH